MKNVFIGKDVIELVGNAMYLDPLTVYREYIQNSVDSIDDAISSGLLDSIEQSQIDITIDTISRKISVRDNGSGIAKSDFLDRMLSIGGSKKRKTSARGFRGVGRLAGLGFCQELIFRTRLKGDDVCQLKWDVRQMKMALSQYDGDGEISDLIKEVTEFTTLPSGDYPEHFFEVEMVKPIRVGGDTLLNLDRIQNYISQIAPVPFSKTFILGESILTHVKEYGELKEYNIYINGSAECIVKPYENTFYFSENKSGNLIKKIEPICIENLDGEITAAGWIAHHDYQGAIPPRAQVGGLRARIGNIQIGERDVFSEVFPEERFNSWTVGELHIFDKGLIPNGRRDGFEHNGHLTNLKNKLLPHAHNVAKQCRSQSSLRNIRKRVELAFYNAELNAGIIEQGSVTATMVELKISDTKGRLAEAETLIPSAQYDDVQIIEFQNKSRAIINRLSGERTRKINKVGLDNLPQSERNTYNKVFDLVYECSSSQLSAKVLIDKMIARL